MLQQPQKNQQESINQSTTTCNKNLQTRIIIPQDTKQSQTSKVHKTIKKQTKKIHKEEKDEEEDEEASPPKAQRKERNNKQHWTSCRILQQKQTRVCD
jgi:hypothetical protein